MKKIFITAIVIFNTFFTAPIFAKAVQCPTVAQLKNEWSPSTIAHIESSGTEVTFYQSPHQYGTNTTWYVNLTVEESDVSRALNKAIESLNNSTFLGGGMTPFGFYSCGYTTPTGEMIYAIANN